MTREYSLTDLGWRPFFQQQLQFDELEVTTPARILEQHRSEVHVVTEAGRRVLVIDHSMPPLTVGDWILLDAEGRVSRALDRISCFRRKAAGSKVSEQLIAANVDTAFIMCSLNDDFNLNRIERYLSVVNEAGAEPVVVLSKMDLCADPAPLLEEVRKLDSLLCVEMLDCREAGNVSALMPWCQPGKTVAMMGSSGAGKSTLTNSLIGENRQTTGAIREDDDKGRHTTTRRTLLQMPNSAMILDTPGMRELQLADCEEGVAVTFADIEALSRHCRFNDCKHGNEPGCEVQRAIESGDLNERRLANYCKLLREQAKNAASLADRRASNRKQSRYYKRVQLEAKKIKRG